MCNLLKKSLFLTGSDLGSQVLCPLTGSLAGVYRDWIFHTVSPVVSLAYSARQNVSQALKKKNVPIGWISIWHLVND